MSEIPMEVNVQDVKALQDAGSEFLLLDCREADECGLVSIEGSLKVPMGELTGRVGELEPFKGKRVIVHCHHGGRSFRVAHWLRQQGYDQAQSMAGGIDSWATQIDNSLPRY